MNKISVILILSCLAVSLTASYVPKQIGQLDIKLPGFAKFVPTPNNSNHHLIISSFNGMPYSSDNVFYLPNISSLDFSTVQTLNNDNLEWPNEASFFDHSIINNKTDAYGGVVVPSGFLVPTKGIFKLIINFKKNEIILKII